MIVKYCITNVLCRKKTLSSVMLGKNELNIQKDGNLYRMSKLNKNSGLRSKTVKPLDENRKASTTLAYNVQLLF